MPTSSASIPGANACLPRSPSPILEAMRISRGNGAAILSTIVDIARRIDRRDKLRELCETLSNHADIDDQRLGRLTRTIRRLR